MKCVSHTPLLPDGPANVHATWPWLTSISHMVNPATGATLVVGGIAALDATTAQPVTTFRPAPMEQSWAMLSAFCREYPAGDFQTVAMMGNDIMR
jgi:hypothetical protein